MALQVTRYFPTLFKILTDSRNAHLSISKIVIIEFRIFMLAGVSIGGRMTSQALFICILLMTCISWTPAGNPCSQVK